MVIATQNPIEMEGTYRLPEAQLDRFLMRISIGYPAEDSELEMIDAHLVERGLPQAQVGVVTLDGIAQVIGAVREVEVATGVRRYVVRLAEATRNDPRCRLGASPRAVLGVIRAAQAAAARSGRWYVTPDDVQVVARPTLCHRMIVEAGASVDGVRSETIIADALSSVPVPQVRTS
jgi:MoxR-like ATPase